MNRSFPALARPALACVLLALPALGQDGGVVPGDELRIRGQSITEMERTLADRDREVLHLYDPFELVGHEEGENEIRSGTPLLARADRSRNHYDPDLERERRIELYESRARTVAAPMIARTSQPYLPPESEAAPATSPAAADPGQEEGGSLLPTVLGVLALLGLLGYGLKRRGLLGS